MKIALIGYGKMGREIEKIALERGHEIVARIQSSNYNELNELGTDAVNVAIEFTTPHTAVANINLCIEKGWNTVCGSTGWLHHLPEIEQKIIGSSIGFIYASNFSLGVNLFFELNKKLAQLLAPYDNYKASITEIHHTAKKDAPSGTAVSLAEQILNNNPHYKSWKLVDEFSNIPTDELPITSIREDPAPGTHIINYRSSIDDIDIRHTAHGRTGFAFGAVLAAEFIQNKNGIFTMKDVLKL